MTSKGRQVRSSTVNTGNYLSRGKRKFGLAGGPGNKVAVRVSNNGSATTRISRTPKQAKRFGQSKVNILSSAQGRRVQKIFGQVPGSKVSTRARADGSSG